MRVYSIMPQMRANSVQKNYKSDRAGMPDSVYFNPPQIKRGVTLTFTGNDKNIHQFASYAPENKRYGVKAYNLGGLGVVAQEAPESWRIKEGADIRDFSPYHSYDNGTGGVTVVKLTKTSIKYPRRYVEIKNRSL